MSVSVAVCPVPRPGPVPEAVSDCSTISLGNRDSLVP